MTTVTIGSSKRHAQFLCPFTKVASELNMQDANAAVYKLLVDKGLHSSLYIALLAAVEAQQQTVGQSCLCWTTYASRLRGYLSNPITCRQ